MNLSQGQGLVALLVAAAPLMAQEIPVVEKTLSNGMRLLMVERHDQPTIAAGWVARVGSANERPGITGLAHLFEHMMFKGSKIIGTRNATRDGELNDLQDKLQAQIREEMSILRDKQRRGEITNMMDQKVRTPRLQKLLEEFEALVKEQRGLIVKDEIWNLYQAYGATGLNASTSQDRTAYIVTIPSNKLELWTWMESDRITNPVFREFYSERNVILEERRQTLESRPDGLVSEAFNAMTWMAHPYHWQVIGWPSDIAQVTREEANKFFATYYAPNNLTAILVGDFNPDQAYALAEKYFSRVKANPNGVPEVTTLEPKQPAEQRMVAEVESTPGIEAVYKAVPSVHQDAPALQALASILGGGGGGRMGGRAASGRLYKALVLGQKVATSATAMSRGQKYGGLFTLRATPAAGRRPEEVEPLLYAELDKIVKDGVTDQELERVKKAAKVAFYSRMDSNEGLRSILSEAESAGSYRDIAESQKRLQAVTKEDIQRVAKQYLVRNSRSVLITHRVGTKGRPVRERSQQTEAK
ncbi:MAG: pitrilysin family protein [Holophaga sp.]|nr:pitrilysin family protein [Holophaga sp.]